jgi:enoyl-CoA hydratase
MSDDDVVTWEMADGIATITINRPEARNALSTAVLREIRASVQAAELDEHVDVMILTGADPAFSAGVDLKEAGSGGRPRGSGDPVESARGPFPEHAKPLIGAVNGVAVTGGLELALQCDFLIASEHARFADTHSRVGVQPGWGLTVLLPQAIGIRRARQMSATGNYVDADQALAWGLVNEVVAHDQLLARCREIAADIRSNDQDNVRRLFVTYDLVAAGTLEEGWATEKARSNEWPGNEWDPAEIEARRQDVIDRGRAQQR